MSDDIDYDQLELAMQDEPEIIAAAEIPKKKKPKPEIDPQRAHLAATIQDDLIVSCENIAANNDEIKARSAEFYPTLPYVFTDLTPTTYTIDTRLGGVKFNENTFTQFIEIRGQTASVASNFHAAASEDYQSVKPRKTNRGRKKKDKPKKPRKKSGTGNCFCSQVSIHILSRTIPEKVYKIKVFRNGYIGVPGALPGYEKDAIAAAEDVTAAMSDALSRYYSTELMPLEILLAKFPDCKTREEIITSAAAKNKLTFINTKLKNYRFSIIKKPDEIIDLTFLKRVITAHASKKSTEEIEYFAPPQMDDNHYAPTLFYTTFRSIEETKLTVSFHTPKLGELEKTTSFNIFGKGKICLFGGFDNKSTISMMIYLNRIFSQYREKIIVCPPPPTSPAKFAAADNIDISALNEHLLTCDDTVPSYLKHII